MRFRCHAAGFILSRRTTARKGGSLPRQVVALAPQSIAGPGLTVPGVRHVAGGDVAMLLEKPAPAASLPDPASTPPGSIWRCDSPPPLTPARRAPAARRASRGPAAPSNPAP